MELNIFCGHFSGYVGAHYLNLPTTTQVEHRQSIFIDAYESFSTVPKETTQFLEDLDEDLKMEEEKEEEDFNYNDEDDDDDDEEEEDFSYGISNRRRRMKESNDNNNSHKDISNDFMELYQSMLSQEKDKKRHSSMKSTSSYNINKHTKTPLNTWSGKVTPIIQPQQIKRKYDNTSPASKLQELERKRKRKQLREYVARATGIDSSSENFRTLFADLCDDTDDVMTDATQPSCTTSDLEGWGDLLAAPLHPRGLCPVPDAQDLSQRWGAVGNALVSSVRDESAECVRFFAEECDRVGGFKFVVDAQSAWGRLGEAVLESVREEFPKAAVLCIPAHNFGFNFGDFEAAGAAPLTQQKRLQAAGAGVCAALCAKSLSQMATLTLPLISPFVRFSEKINSQAKKNFFLRPEEKFSYDASPLALSLNALTAVHTPLPETLALLSPVGTSVNAAVAELCVAPSPTELRRAVTSVPMSPFAENRLRKSDVMSERAYSLVQGTRGLGGGSEQPLQLLTPSRTWDPRAGTTIVGGSKEMLSPLMYFPSRMYADVFPGFGTTAGRSVQSVSTAGIFHSSAEVFKYFDGLARVVREGAPRECLQMLLDDSTGTRMEIADELSQIADDYIRF